MESLLSILVHGLLSIPGAFVRWLCLGRKQSFDDTLYEYPMLNAFIGGLVMVPIIIMLVVVFG